MALIHQSELKLRNNGVTTDVKSNIKHSGILRMGHHGAKEGWDFACVEHHSERRECERSGTITSRCIFC
jgi:hypothetical protein